jgi:hypothetical protein
MRTMQEFVNDLSRVRFDSEGIILISVMLLSQMIIAGVRHSPYSSKTPPPTIIRLIGTLTPSFLPIMPLSRK